MNDEQLDQLLGLAKIQAEMSYGEKIQWCALVIERFHHTTGNRVTEFIVSFRFDSSNVLHQESAETFSAVIAKIKANAPAPKEPECSPVGGRRVLIEKKATVPA